MAEPLEALDDLPPMSPQEAAECEAMVEQVITLMDGGATLAGALLTVLEADDARREHRYGH